MLGYSTLQEAYPNTNKKKKTQETFESDYTGKEDCYYNKNYNFKLNSCEKKETFDNQSPPQKVPCEPLQTPNYDIPISSDTKKSFDNTYNVFVDNKNIKMKD
jgi:hypothetical protein